MYGCFLLWGWISSFSHIHGRFRFPGDGKGIIGNEICSPLPLVGEGKKVGFPLISFLGILNKYTAKKGEDCLFPFIFWGWGDFGTGGAVVWAQGKGCTYLWKRGPEKTWVETFSFVFCCQMSQFMLFFG